MIFWLVLEIVLDLEVWIWYIEEIRIFIVDEGFIIGRIGRLVCFKFFIVYIKLKKKIYEIMKRNIKYELIYLRRVWRELRRGDVDSGVGK